MKRTRIQHKPLTSKRQQRRELRCGVLPLDPRDPEVLRAKGIGRRRTIW